MDQHLHDVANNGGSLAVEVPAELIALTHLSTCGAMTTDKERQVEVSYAEQGEQHIPHGNHLSFSLAPNIVVPWEGEHRNLVCWCDVVLMCGLFCRICCIIFHRFTQKYKHEHRETF